MSQSHPLPDHLRLGPVRLQVADLTRSVTWYESVLGMRVQNRREDRGILGPQDAATELVELLERHGARPAPKRGRLGLYHFAVLLPDRAALGRFVAHLAATGVRAGASDHAVSEALYLTDPDGLGIEVYADRPRAEWRWANGELQMGTEPLDLEALLAAAGDRPWAGMPAGTRMGHLHLHVGDLERAAAFYAGALGLSPTVRSYPGALFLSAGGYHHHLGLNTWAGPDARPPDETDARLLEWTVLLPDATEADAVGRRMADAGHPAVPADGGWRVTDPWGTALRLAAADAG